MRKLFSMFLVAFTLVLAGNSYALVDGLGWDAGTSQLTVRSGNLDLGVGGLRDKNMDPTLSANLLLAPLVKTDRLAAYPVVGAMWNVDGRVVTGFVGVMPEIVFEKHLALSTRFGLNVPLYNDGLHPHYNLTGEPVSLVHGVNFKVLF